mmetsp:Transcript_12725/g.26995  ORF Transcript_12725/g.26995 Transcript_12725/m.26995 type:complete len:390 (-) Transcript_12725:1535-2704(-)
MSGVTWGNNTVHTIGGAPAPSAFGAPAPAFGAPAPTPATGGFGFGASPAKPPMGGGSLFGAPAPASGGFGSLGQPQKPQMPQHHIPAQAAMQAKMTAERVVEAERIRTKIEKLHREYSGTCIVPEDGQESAKFVTIVYNELTPEERQFRLIHGLATGQPQHQGPHSQTYGHSQKQQPIFAPQRPPQINSRDWKLAVVNNPDPSNYVPTPIIGAVALQGRVSNQQNRAKAYANNAVLVQKNLEFIRQREAMARQDLMEKDRRYSTMRRRLLELMTRVEVARCLNKPLQADEHRVMQRLTKLLDQVEQLRGAFVTLSDQAKTQSLRSDSHGAFQNRMDDGNIGLNNEELLGILMEQRRKLEKLNETARKDLDDVGLIEHRVVATVESSISQ